MRDKKAVEHEGCRHPNSYRNTLSNTKETIEEIGGHWNKEMAYLVALILFEIS